jgi:hypothetical protein
MMTSEKLRERLLKGSDCTVSWDRAWAVKMLSELEKTAHEEGRQELQALFDLQRSRMYKWQKEWQDENPKERGNTLPDLIQLIEWKIAKAHDEGFREGVESVKQRRSHDPR